MRVRLITRADIPACVSICCDSFIDDSFFAILAPHRHQYPSAWRRFHAERIRKRFITPGMWCLVCVEDIPDTSGKIQEEIIGIAQWRRVSGGPSAYSRSHYVRTIAT